MPISTNTNGRSRKNLSLSMNNVNMDRTRLIAKRGHKKYRLEWPISDKKSAKKKRVVHFETRGHR
jgi:hypothetical protein